MKKTILKGNLTTTYIGHKYKNTGTSVLIYPRNNERQYHEDLLLDFLLKYEVDFSGYFVLIKYIEYSFYQLHFRKESLAHDRLDVLMHENTILRKYHFK